MYCTGNTLSREYWYFLIGQVGGIVLKFFFFFISYSVIVRYAHVTCFQISKAKLTSWYYRMCLWNWTPLWNWTSSKSYMNTIIWCLNITIGSICSYLIQCFRFKRQLSLVCLYNREITASRYLMSQARKNFHKFFNRYN